MASRVRFIHAADLHLGATFKGLMANSERTGLRFIDAISKAYARIIDHCLDAQVDFLVLAGDTFNSGDVSYRVEREFFDGLYKLQDAGIEVYICTGNHDPLASWGSRLPVLPKNTHVFPSDEPGYFLYRASDGSTAAIGGCSYETQSELRDLTKGLDRQTMRNKVGKTDFCVGVLHTAINDPDYAPCTTRAFQRSRLDYWALGHIHEHSYLDKLPVYFPGSPQGLDINETAQHGCLLVTLKDGGRLEQEFVETASIVWAKQAIDCEKLSTTEELYEALVSCGNRLLATYRCPVCVRIALRGRTSLHAAIARESDLRDLRDAVERRCGVGDLWLFIDDIVDKTAAPLDLNKLKSENLFPAMILEEARVFEKNSDATQALLDKEFAALGITDIGASINVKEATRKARNCCLDLLVGGNTP